MNTPSPSVELATSPAQLSAAVWPATAAAALPPQAAARRAPRRPAWAMAGKTRRDKGFKKYNKPHRCSNCGQIGHRIETCPKMQKAPMKAARRMGKARKVAKRMSKRDRKIPYTQGAATKVSKKNLKELEQISYPEICAMTENQAKRKLGELGLLPPMSGRKCFKCSSNMAHQKSQGKYAFMCPKKCCRFKLGRADLAYTPMWAKQFAGVGATHKAFLQALYVVALKVPQDSGRHLVGVGYKEMMNWSKAVHFGFGLR